MAESRSQRLLARGALVLLAGALAVAAYWLLFTAFMLYDDEGYVLISLQNFSRHGGLYDQVYTQYGPFPYLLYDALHRLIGFEFTNTSGRWITFVNWLGTAGGCAALVGRFTRSRAAVIFTLTGVFAYLWVMIAEPVHPGGLIALCVALAAWLGAEAWAARRFLFFAALAGALTGALLMTKINVGVFLAGSAFVWLAVNSASPRPARALAWLAAVGSAALPLVLMHSLFAETWIQLFALIFACAAISALLVSRQAAQPVVTARIWLVFFGTMILVAAGAAAIVLARGTSFGELVRGILIDPLRHPGVYSFAMLWRPGAGVVALLSLALAVGVAARHRWRDARFVECVALARVLFAAIYLLLPFEVIPLSQPGWGTSYGISLAWLCVTPLRDNDARGAAARAWVALLLVFQFLHAYPIAGSQINWGTFLWVPLLALALHDAAPVLTARLSRIGVWVSRAAIAGLIVASLFSAGKYFQLGWTRFSTSQPLRLRGAETLRMPDELTYAMRIVVENLRAHGDLLMSAPGLYSMNLWTGLPTPTLANATHWFSLLDAAQQQQIIDQLAAHPRAVMVVQRRLLDYLVENGFAHRGPLQTWLRQNFERAFALYPYEVWVRRGRTIAPLSTAWVGTDQHPTGGLTLTLRSPGETVARIEVCDVQHPRQPLLTLDARNAAVRITPIALDGQPTGPAEPAKFPFSFSGCVEIAIDYSDRNAASPGPDSLLVLRGADDAVLSEARVLTSPASRRRNTTKNESAKR